MKKNVKYQMETHERLIGDLLDLLEGYKNEIHPAVAVYVIAKLVTNLALECAPGKTEALGIIQEAIFESVQQHGEEI